MDILRTEGVILTTFPFQDEDTILTVYGKDTGLMRLIVKRGDQTKRWKSVISTPFTQAEFVYRVGKSDLFNCQEISVINLHLRLRERLENLEIAHALAQAIQHSAPDGESSFPLYPLFIAYLNKIPDMRDPQILSASFRLKLLRHEGLIHFKEVCPTCQTPLQKGYFVGGEFFCPQHAAPWSICFTSEERDFLLYLAHCQSFKELLELKLSRPFYEQINRIFEEQVRQ